MSKPTKESIIAAYNDLVAKRDGEIIGMGVFIRESGIPHYLFRGGYWRSWSEFQADAGHAPNLPTPKIPDETILSCFAELALEQGRLPTEPDVMLKRRENPNFPDKSGFRRWGNREALLSKVAEFCAGKDQFAPVLLMLDSGASTALDHRLGALRIAGFVYLLRSGKQYKIGRSAAVGQRLRQLAIQLPQKPDTVHVIETDDPEGIESYWHRRFADKRQGGEWFTLSKEDVQAFKRRKFQ